MDKKELEEFFLSHYYARYERSHWDAFLEKNPLTLNVPSIHITGTNGKGSTANYLSHIYMAKGMKVGVFSTPSFYSSNETTKINDAMISDEDMLRIFLANEKQFAKFDLSSFEIQVFIAYTYFNEQQVDLAVIEVGMGGILDATNIITPKLSIVTSVSLEHTAYLGRTVSEVAYSKGGIIKEEVPVLVGKLEESAFTTLKDIAKRFRAPFYEVDDFHHDHLDEDGYHFDYRPFTDLHIKSHALYQLKNASLALEATKILMEQFPISETEVRKGLLCPDLILREEKHGNIVFDGAHNPEATKNLVSTWGGLANGKPVHVLFASFKDKNIAVMLPMLANNAVDITLTTFPHLRARKEMDYFLYEADYHYEEDAYGALDKLRETYPDDVILVTGSLAFAGYMREYVINKLHL